MERMTYLVGTGKLSSTPYFSTVTCLRSSDMNFPRSFKDIYWMFPNSIVSESKLMKGRNLILRIPMGNKHRA